ncbi:tetratricopeptide repeat protein 17 isoform X1 [Octopus sinensis]|uniref:Tetratricopeptide repeat protein 17 isoform X1 n=1 Tax=Octopus sinensis TaxID=2607531 RepID=A0A6P7SL42_9MOLL|nr:tetratricopeptide repeat protein 17 isoform X1 [Octopus sinensis]
MAARVVLLIFSLLLIVYLEAVQTATHWVVTEDGRIQAQVDTVFNMRRPYDLVAFMKQEERAVMLDNLKKELLSRKDEIDKSEDRDTDLEQRFYRSEPDCIAVGKPLPEFDLYISTVLPLENKGIRQEEHIDFKAVPSNKPLPPDCTQVTDLHYSIHAFEHLEGMKARKNLSGTAELGLKNAIPHRDNVDDYGNLIYEAMKKNKTSWVLFNMAAFYWRIKGDSYQVIECLRRALHYSPRMQKDVALISLANVLHRARYSNEAAIVVHAALDVSKELNVNHFTLGNIYAVLGEYNKSVICFENTLKIQPEFEAAAKRKHAVLCHAKLESALEAQHRSLQRTLNDLKDYQRKHDFWQQQNTKLQTEQVPADVKMIQEQTFDQLNSWHSNANLWSKTGNTGANQDDFCQMIDRHGHHILECNRDRKPSSNFDFSLSSEDSSSNTETKEKDPAWSLDAKSTTDYSVPVRAPLYSAESKSHHHKEMPVDWPSKEECDMYVQKFPDPQNMSTVYLSPENKGFEVRALLSEAQSLYAGDEHPLPWYPPICTPLLDITDGSVLTYDHIRSVADRANFALKFPEPAMRQILLDHVNNGIVTKEEVGQRILTALKQSISPNWILFNLAGLYWRILGNAFYGIECIRRALYTVPELYRDVPLINLGSILYRVGRYDDAIVVIKDALMINSVEPLTNYFLGNLLVATQNYTGAVWHYEQALVEPYGLKEAYSALRAVKCQQKFHKPAQSEASHHLSDANGMTDSSTTSPNCQQKIMYSTNIPQGESRVICQTENGAEKCVIETRSHSKSSNCDGHCTQTCTIIPIKLESCASAMSSQGGLGAAVMAATEFNNGICDHDADCPGNKDSCKEEKCHQINVQPHV